MTHKWFLRHGAVPVLLLSLSSGGCTAVLEGGGSDESDDQGLHAEDDSNPEATREIEDEIAETDAELQASDPDLFDIAIRYFPSTDPGGPGQRYYRLTRRQLDNTAAYLLPGLGTSTAIETLPPDPLIRNYELTNDLGLNPVNITPYLEWVEEFVEAVRANPENVAPCAEGDEDCLSQSAAAFVRRAFRGVITDETASVFGSFLSESVGEVGTPDAVADLVDVTLSSPRFAFREEVFTDETGALLQAQALQNLSYTLTDSPPGALGLESSAPSQYFDDAGVSADTLSSVLSRPEARDKLLRFFMAWLEIRDADDFDIAPDFFPEFTPEVAEAMVTETRNFLSAQLSSAAPRLADITDSTESFVSRALSDIYGIEGGTGDVAVPLSPEERYGIFTHPSFIASHSGPTDTRLVKRGAYFTRKVMCQELGEPPPNAIPIGPIPGNTERERIEGVTAPPACAGCHSYINPFGFMLESYDAIGRFRTEDENGFAIEPSILVDFLDEGPLAAERSVDGLAGFTSSAMFRQCFVRQLFTFYMGRRPTESDDQTMREMFFRFSEGENDQLVPVLQILAESTNFNRRLPSP